MARKRRSGYEMLVDVLSVCTKPLLKTDVMYQARLQHKTLKNILACAESAGLLDRINDKYYVTEKGRKFLHEWRVLQSFLKSESRLKAMTAPQMER